MAALQLDLESSLARATQLLNKTKRNIRQEPTKRVLAPKPVRSNTTKTPTKTPTKPAKILSPPQASVPTDLFKLQKQILDHNQALVQQQQDFMIAATKRQMDGLVEMQSYQSAGISRMMVDQATEWQENQKVMAGLSKPKPTTLPPSTPTLPISTPAPIPQPHPRLAAQFQRDPRSMLTDAPMPPPPKPQTRMLDRGKEVLEKAVEMARKERETNDVLSGLTARVQAINSNVDKLLQIVEVIFGVDFRIRRMW